jgi:hypothetical protein
MLGSTVWVHKTGHSTVTHGICVYKIGGRRGEVIIAIIIHKISPFWAIAFLRRFCQIASGFHLFVFRNSNFFTEKVSEPWVQPPTWRTSSVYACPLVTGWPSFFNWYSGGVESNWVHSALRPLMAYCVSPGWLWWWRNWWNEGWQENPKYSEKTCSSAALSTTNPTCSARTRNRAAAVGSQRLTAWATALPGGPGTGFPSHRLLLFPGLRWRYSKPPPHGKRGETGTKFVEDAEKN